jgi:hypothetical protein
MHVWRLERGGQKPSLEVARRLARQRSRRFKLS